MNKIAITGKLVNDATQTMPIYGIEGLYAVEVEVIRTSGVIDKLQCTVAINETQYEMNVKRHCYIPCITWGRSAKFAERLQKGDKVSLEGRLQSRDYVKHGEVKTTHEVSVQTIQKMA